MGRDTKIVEELLTKPFSQDSDLDHVPFRDMEAYVHRSVEIRHKELGLGKPKRPCNHFVLYLTANHARAKAWRDAHRTELPEVSHPMHMISTILSRSWSLEPPSVKSKYQALAVIDKQMNAKAFPNYKYKPRRKQDKSRTLPSTTDAKQAETKAAIMPQPLPSLYPASHDPFSSSSTYQKDLSPHIFQRLASLSSRAKELESFLTLCQKSEVMRAAYWPTDKGLDYELACLEYNSFVASTYEQLRNHVRNIQLLEPYVPKIFNLQWSYDETIGMYKVSLPTYTWPSLELTMPANFSIPMPIPMEIDQQVPLDGLEIGFSADIGVVPSMNTNHPRVSLEDSLANFADISDSDIERALQEFEVAGANTNASEPVVNEPTVNEPAQVEQVPLPDFTGTEGLTDADLFLDQQLSKAVDENMNLSFQDIISMDMIMEESEMPL
ncbi:uncharacterized protein B0T23DRAFT_228627 [Neurospora hispaniola]|uniref:HMG box domain-containing protein n=1 Tax=Neurospora hispaniola TaxID=588809 RepID=A0AAJ0MN01_9PEZI|nr:hypothetical protein B0T23DRAFT_228627 [Neurospora hispaniola]